MLLVSWLEFHKDEGYQFLEYYSGCARMAQLAAGFGLRTEAYDLEYGRRRAELKGKRSCMDINSNCGMVLLC